MNRVKIIILSVLIVCLIATGVFLKNRNTEEWSVTLLCPSDAAELFEVLGQAAHTGWSTPNVVLEVVDAAEYSAAVESRLADADPPDMVVFTANADIAAAQTARLADLTALLKGTHTMISVEKGDPLRVLPLCGDVPLIFYNKQLFSEEGVAEPEDMNQFIRVCSYFQMREICPLGLSLDPVTEGGDIAPLVDSFLVNASDASDVTPEEAAQYGVLMGLLSPLETMRNIGLFEQECAADRSQLFQAFKAGTYAMVPGYASEISKMDGMNLPFQYGAFLLSGNSMVTRGVMAPTVSIAMSEDAGEPAQVFAAFLLSEEGQQMIGSRSNAVPIRNNLTQQSDIKKEICAKLENTGMTPSFLIKLTEEQRVDFLLTLHRMVIGEDVEFAQVSRILSGSENNEGGK